MLLQFAHNRIKNAEKNNKQGLHFHNPSYEASSTAQQLPLSQARAKLESEIKDSEQTYDNLNRGQIKRKLTCFKTYAVVYIVQIDTLCDPSCRAE